MSDAEIEKELEGFRCALILDERSHATADKYCHEAAVFLRWLGEAKLSKESVIRYKQELTEHRAPAGVNVVLAALNRYFRLIGRHDCAVRSLRIQRPAFRQGERTLSLEEYYRLLEAARNKGDRRLCLLMQTLCSTGIRVSELPFITMEAARRGSAWISLKGKTRQVLLPELLCCRLLDYAAEQGIKDGSIFVSCHGNCLDRSNIHHQMQALGAASGVAACKIYPHNLRHLFACVYYQKERDISRLADILGHTNINTTRIYTSTSAAEQRECIDSLGLVT